MSTDCPLCDFEWIDSIGSTHITCICGVMFEAESNMFQLETGEWFSAEELKRIRQLKAFL